MLKFIKRDCVIPVLYFNMVFVSTVIFSSAASADEGVRLAVRFDKTVHGAVGAANPFGMAAHVHLQDGVAKFEGHDPFPKSNAVRQGADKSSLVYGGKNIHSAKGSVAIDVKFDGMRGWDDQHNTWLLSLIPRVGELGFRLKQESGTALSVIKNAKGELTVGVHQSFAGKYGINLMIKKKQTAPVDETPIAFSVKDLAKEKWHRVRLSWDQGAEGAGKVWLSVGDKTQSAPLKFHKSLYHSLLVGTPPEAGYAEIQKGFDGSVDNLLVTDQTPDESPDAAMTMPATEGKAAPILRSLPAATIFLPNTKDEKNATNDWFNKLEVATRSHLDLAAASQGKHGGWQFTVAYPSMFSILSHRAIVPISSRFFNGSKSSNSASTALKFLAAYDALGETRYLDIAKKSAETLMKMQNPKTGNFYYWSLFDEKTGTFEIGRPHAAPFEDHVQTHPIILLYRLYAITEDERYRQSAERAINFIYKGQNPNGAWSHHYSLKRGHGLTGYRGGHDYNGEINDYTTADQMIIMLLAYRMTGEQKYLASYLKGADWFVKAFIDGKGAKGWCPQYDQNIKPIGTRHFEPPAIVLSEGMRSAPEMLVLSYAMTGNDAFREPLRNWSAWMNKKKVVMKNGKPGWYINYKIETGKPFRHANFKDWPVYERDLRGFGMQPILNNVARCLRGKYKIKKTSTTKNTAVNAKQKTSIKKAQKKPEDWKLAARFLNKFDWQAGTWIFGGKNGVRQFFNPSSLRILPLCRTLLLERVRRGEISADHPMAKLSQDDWLKVIYHLMPKHELFKPIDSATLRAARQLNSPHLKGT